MFTKAETILTQKAEGLVTAEEAVTQLIELIRNGHPDALAGEPALQPLFDKFVRDEGGMLIVADTLASCVTLPAWKNPGTPEAWRDPAALRLLALAMRYDAGRTLQCSEDLERQADRYEARARK